MNIPASRWYRVIEKRRSRRQFTDMMPRDNHLKRIQSICDNFRPFNSARAVLVRETPDNVFKGVIGSYGVIKGAKAFIVFIGNTRSAAVQEQVGYTGEGIILEAEASSLNTCWVGGSFRQDLVSSMVDMRKEEKVFAISPVGYAKNKPTFNERILSGFGFTHRRKSLSSLVIGMGEKEWPDWMKASFEAARLAPSAVNRQPWQFFAAEDSITVAVNDKSIKRETAMSKRLDCGIAMLHIEIAALNFGMSGKWEFLKAPGVGRFKVDSTQRPKLKR